MGGDELLECAGNSHLTQAVNRCGDDLGLLVLETLCQGLGHVIVGHGDGSGDRFELLHDVGALLEGLFEQLDSGLDLLRIDLGLVLVCVLHVFGCKESEYPLIPKWWG